MYEFLLLLIPIFLAGLLRGSSVCTLVCAPGLFSLIMTRKRSAREAVKLATLFNLPRILFMAGLGALVGYISFTLLVNASWFQGLALRIGQTSYFIFGVILTGFGAVTYAKTADRRATLEKEDDGCLACSTPCPTGTTRSDATPAACGGCTISCAPPTASTLAPGPEPVADQHTPDPESNATPASSWYQRLVPTTRNRRESILVLIWGGLISTACFAEITVISIQLPAFATIMGSFGPSSALAAAYAGLAMAIFAIGSALPIIVLAAAGGLLSTRVGTEKKLLAVRTIGAVVMIMVGLVLIFTSIRGVLLVF